MGVRWVRPSRCLGFDWESPWILPLTWPSVERSLVLVSWSCAAEGLVARGLRVLRHWGGGVDEPEQAVSRIGFLGVGDILWAGARENSTRGKGERLAKEGYGADP